VILRHDALEGTATALIIASAMQRQKDRCTEPEDMVGRPRQVLPPRQPQIIGVIRVILSSAVCAGLLLLIMVSFCRLVSCGMCMGASFPEPAVLGDPAGWRAVPAGLAGAEQRKVNGAVAEEPAAAGEVAGRMLRAGPGGFGGGVTIFLVAGHSVPVSVSARAMSPSNSAARSAWPWSRAWSRCRVRMGRNCVPVRK
jgi:hypothetical protein